MKIEFVSYDGRYPNLCRGRLVVKINGKKVSFGNTDERYLMPGELKADYTSFWMSGGGISTEPDSGMSSRKGPWELNYCFDSLPEKIKKLVPELLELMNENVPQGCCGGCI